MAQQDKCFSQLTNHHDIDKIMLIRVGENCKEDFSDDETSSSGVYSDFTTSSAASSQQFLIMNSDPAARLFEKIMSSFENNPLMKVYKSFQFIKLAINLYKDDEVIQKEWTKMINYYENNLKCNDYHRIEFEFGKCIDAIMNDERKIMIGLDSSEVVKDVLITCMRICSEPDFKLEIRVGLGGTNDPLTARTPAYAIAGIALLYRLRELSKTFSSNKESHPEIIPTTMLRNPPHLIFFSAYTAAVEVNKMDENIAKNIAVDILSYIQAYINKYHSDVAEYVRYGMDHSNTYQSDLVDRISELFTSNCDDDTLLKALATQADTHGGTMKGSIKYASIHSIAFTDIIDKKNSHSLFNPLNQNETNVQSNQEIYLPDCIISIGGSVERRFGQVRQIIRQAFRESLQKNNEDRYHIPLSIQMLSQAGQIPVYYHHPTQEITFNSVLNSNTDDLYQNEEIARAIKEDLLIITDDIGTRILKPMFQDINKNKTSEISSWEKSVSTLIELCSESLEEHAKDENQTCKCSKETTDAVAQFFEHYDILNYLDDHRHSIISCIIDSLENQKRKQKEKQEQKQKQKQKQNRVPFTTNNSRPRNDGESSTKQPTNDLPSRSYIQPPARETIKSINKQLDSILCPIFVAFIKEFGKNNNQKQMNDDKST